MGGRRGKSRRAPGVAATPPERNGSGAQEAPAPADATMRRSRRWPLVDMARGAAILAMISYHFCFDLAFNGWLAADFVHDARWIAFRSAILGSFLFIAGFSLALAGAGGQSTTRFLKRVALIGAAAGLVSLGSYLMFPASYIYFGVLHAIAVMSLLARPALRLGRALALAGVAVLLLGTTVQHPFFDQPALHWIGLMTFKPRTEDYVPLFPWFGMMLLGAAAGVQAARGSRRATVEAVPGPPSHLAWLGRHSLAVYLVHQPILLGAMVLVRHLH
jgi:uncharacterized membrane protein